MEKDGGTNGQTQHNPSKKYGPFCQYRSTPHALMGKYGFVTFESDVFTFDL